MMRQSLQQPTARAATAVLLTLTVALMWAVSGDGAAHTSVYAQAARIEQTLGAGARALPAPVRFQEDAAHGLIVRAWFNGTGPYTCALDTGAGANIISTRTARAAGVNLAGAHVVSISGLSGVGGAAREASVQRLALGEPTNTLPGRGLVIVTDGLPADLDGILDPTESFYPLGYTIDLPRNELSAFDPRATPLRRNDSPPGGTVVPWLADGTGRRPFIPLTPGRRALLDTGSGFGLALHESAARDLGVSAGGGRERAGVRDLGRGHVSARRIAPVTVQIGALVLRRMPTDLLSGATDDAPIILGRDALRPFRLTFDPINRLIRIAPR